MRGEYFLSDNAVVISLGSPPLARGIPYRLQVVISKTGITPACAGNTLRHLCKVSRSQDHPRLRGEYKAGFKRTTRGKGSPPLARGIPWILSIPGSQYRITPACAGNTNAVELPRIYPWDHPRLRGEYLSDFTSAILSLGSPPLARGILDFASSPPKTLRITPACAGNTKPDLREQRAVRDHPRLRGEYDGWINIPEIDKGSPPLARGIPDNLRVPLRLSGITPACAGNTYDNFITLGAKRDHPRLRGEY